MSVDGLSQLEESAVAAAGGERAAAASRLPREPVVLNDAEAGSAAFSLRDIWAYRELLYYLTWRDVKVRYKQTAMGATWAVVQPLVLVIIFAVFFGLIMGVHTDGMPFIVFFYCGMLPWMFFSNSLVVSSGSLINSSNLITKIYFPRSIIPIASVAGGLIDFAITTAILLGLMPIYKIGFRPSLLALPALLLLTLLLSVAFGILFSALTVKYRDIRHVLPFVLQILFYVTPIIYPLSLLSDRWRLLMYVNPLTGIVEAVRSSVAGRPFPGWALAASAVITAALLAISVAVFRRIEKSFADLI